MKKVQLNLIVKNLHFNILYYYIKLNFIYKKLKIGKIIYLIINNA